MGVEEYKNTGNSPTTSRPSFLMDVPPSFKLQTLDFKLP